VGETPWRFESSQPHSDEVPAKRNTRARLDRPPTVRTTRAWGSNWGPFFSAEAHFEEAVPASSHAAVIARLRCFRGIDTLSAAGLCADIGRFDRFATPTLLSGFLGIVPCEYSSDSKRVQGAITKAGPTHARRLLVEAAHHYRRRPRISRELAARQAGQDPRVDRRGGRSRRRGQRGRLRCRPGAGAGGY
jgi:Transposase IS116/IS110/IS902 family